MDSEKNEKNILITTCYGHFLSHYNMLAFPALVLPLSTQLNIPVARVLEMSFAMYFLFGVTALFWGITADKTGSKPLFYIFFTGAGISGLMAGLGSGIPLCLPLSLACLGAFSGIHHPVGLGLISKEMKQVSRAHGTHGMFGNLGLAMAPLITGLLNWAISPSAAYIFLGALNLSGLIILIRFPFQETQFTDTTDHEANEKTLSPFLILLVAMMLGGVVYRGATIITPTLFELNTTDFLINVNTLVPGTLSPNLFATLLTSAIFLAGILAQYTGGRLAEKYTPEYIYLFFHCMTIPLAFIVSTASGVSLFIAIGLFFFFLLGMQPSENTLVKTRVPRKLLSSSYGLKFVLTFGVGAASVKGAGMIADQYGLSSVFFAIGSTSVLLVGTIMILIVNVKSKGLFNLNQKRQTNAEKKFS